MTEQPVIDEHTSTDPLQDSAWRSYLKPGTDVLRTVPELTSPFAVAFYERMVSANNEAALRDAADRPRTFDLAHLNDIHGRLFADVYPFAGQLRYVDIGKPGQTGEPFLHHRWIDTYTAAVTDQLRTQDHMTAHNDPTQWADRAAYFWAALLHAHPYREGNGRATRLWMEDLAAAAGHELDWTRGSPERNVHVARAAAHGDYEPIRALLTVAARGAVGIDRPIDALNDLDALQHRQAWARTGLVFGTETEQARLAPEILDLTQRIAAVRSYLDAHPLQHSTDQPAPDRWRGLAASVRPELTMGEDWPRFAADLDAGAAAGIDVATELPRLAVSDTPGPATPARPAIPPTTPPKRPPTTAPRSIELGTVDPPAAAAAAYAAPHRPSTGPRR